MTLKELKQIVQEQLGNVEDAIIEWGENEKVDLREMTGDCYGSVLMEVVGQGVVDFDDLVNTSEED